MTMDRTRCAHCDSPIVDPTSQVIHGNATFCCRNCSHAMEQSGSGTDPQAGEHQGDLRCAHCGCAIVDETTMETRGDDAYCCRNCVEAISASSTR